MCHTLEKFLASGKKKVCDIIKDIYYISQYLPLLTLLTLYKVLGDMCKQFACSHHADFLQDLCKCIDKNF